MEIARVKSPRQAKSFHDRLPKITFIGDWAGPLRSRIAKSLELGNKATLHGTAKGPLGTSPCSQANGFNWRAAADHPHYQAYEYSTVMRPLARANALLGRPLFGYENTDYWIVNPFTGEFNMPRKFWQRLARDSEPGTDVEWGT